MGQKKHKKQPVGWAEKLGIASLERLKGRDWLLLALVLLFAGFVRGWRLGFPDRQYFDECYYVPGAISYIEHTKDKNSVHPPLGKIQIAIGMRFGSLLNKLGFNLSEYTRWRLTVFFEGLLFVLLTYFLAYRVSGGKTDIALAAMFFTSVDFMAVSLSRICLLDMPVGLWMLVGYIFAWLYLEAKSAGSGKEFYYAWGSAVACGITVASKWNGLFGGLTSFLIMLLLPAFSERTSLKEHFRRFYKDYLKTALKLFLIFAVSVTAIYAASFIPRFNMQGYSAKTVKAIYKDHVRMVKFRYDIKQLNHRYLSKFYTWPFCIRPVWMHWEPCKADKVKMTAGTICIGSIFLWWPGFVFTLELLYLGLKERTRGWIFIGCCYLGQWIFWAVSTTGGFIYYLIPGVPFLAYAMANAVYDWSEEKSLGVMIVCIGLISVSFALYYPFLSSILVPRSYFEILFPPFLHSWR